VAETSAEAVGRYPDPCCGSGDVLHQDEFALDLPDHFLASDSSSKPIPAPKRLWLPDPHSVDGPLDFFELAFIVTPLLAPAADKLGIDLIWFGVMLGVNMQTSFMHPPFGFALFFRRSVAPKTPYVDRVTKKRMEPVETSQIY
jgi:hypothetical protein